MKRKINKKRAITPPTTPPTIGAIFVVKGAEFEEGVGAEVGVEGFTCVAVYAAGEKQG